MQICHVVCNEQWEKQVCVPTQVIRIGCEEGCLFSWTHIYWTFSGGASGKESACPCRRCKRRGFDPRVGKIPWRRAGQPTPVFLPGESHGHRSLAGYSSELQSQTQQKRLSTHAYYTALPYFRGEFQILQKNGITFLLLKWLGYG